MTPTPSLTELLGDGALVRVPVDPQVVRSLQRQASNHLGTAQAAARLGDAEGAFTMAYDACRKTVTALLEAAQALAVSFARQRIVGEAADLGHVRNGAQYRGEEITGEQAAEAREIAGELIAALSAPIDALLSR